jgi:hypothetical protein
VGHVESSHVARDVAISRSLKSPELGAPRCSRRFALLAVFLCSACVTQAGTIAQWSEDASREARRASFLESRKSFRERLVAIVCSEETEIDRRYADYCAVLQRALAAEMMSERVRAVFPRGDFSNVLSWDHISCGEMDRVEGLGWEVIELRAARKRRRKITFVAELRRDGKELKRGPLAIAELRAFAREAEGGQESAGVSSEPEEVEETASCLAWSIICDLKQLPDKHRIESVRIDENLTSPAQIAGMRNVGESLVDHLNRVISSSFYISDPHVLELSLAGQSEGDVQAPAAKCNLGSKTVTARVSAPSAQTVGAGGIHDEREPSASEGSVQPPDHTRRTDSAATPTVASARAAEHGSLPEEIEALGHVLGVSEAAIVLCAKIVDRPERERNAFVRLLRFYDPRSQDANALEVWREWYQFADPNHEPRFPGSPANAFATEVADSVYATLE